ncbi:serine/threonine protein kinase, putative [Plasmodium relictum]|uniref:non-specific serine/threonine protein kinase n=1 Tax=Plasmodium relictum TaxID=85471 RepID=A0A1J1HC93_PLARL|nr:serine/threonine protein kinase, putative [Plasmodium relictum]CRH03068.1 serine/threonine protein kinase, putative [Plasmodium relictum]
MLRREKKLKKKVYSDEFNNINKKIKDKFIFIYLIAVGGFSCVYKIKKKKKKKFYALKNVKFSANIFNYEKKILLNLREIECLNKLKNHPNIVRMHDCWLEVNEVLSKSKKKKNLIISLSGDLQKNNKKRSSNPSNNIKSLYLNKNKNKVTAGNLLQLSKANVFKEINYFNNNEEIDINNYQLVTFKNNCNKNEVCKNKINFANVSENLKKKKKSNNGKTEKENILFFSDIYLIRKNNSFFKMNSYDKWKMLQLYENYLEKEKPKPSHDIYKMSDLNDFFMKIKKTKDDFKIYYNFFSNLSNNPSYLQIKFKNKCDLNYFILCKNINNFTNLLFKNNYKISWTYKKYFSSLTNIKENNNNKQYNFFLCRNLLCNKKKFKKTGYAYKYNRFILKSCFSSNYLKINKDLKKSKTNQSNKIIYKHKLKKNIIFHIKGNTHIYKTIGNFLYIVGISKLNLNDSKNILNKYLLKNIKLRYLIWNNSNNNNENNFIHPKKYELSDNKCSLKYYILYEKTKRKFYDLTNAHNSVIKREENKRKKIVLKKKKKDIHFSSFNNYLLFFYKTQKNFEIKNKKVVKITPSNLYVELVVLLFNLLFNKDKKKIANEIYINLKNFKMLQHNLNINKLDDYYNNINIKKKNVIIKSFLLRILFFLILKNIEINMEISFNLFLKKTKNMFLININYQERLIRIYLLVLFKILKSRKVRIISKIQQNICSVLKYVVAFYNIIRNRSINNVKNTNFINIKKWNRINELILQNKLKYNSVLKKEDYESKLYHHKTMKKTEKYKSCLSYTGNENDDNNNNFNCSNDYYSYFIDKNENNIKNAYIREYNFNYFHNMNDRKHYSKSINKDILNWNLINPIIKYENNLKENFFYNPIKKNNLKNTINNNKNIKRPFNVPLKNDFIDQKKFIRFKYDDTYFMHELKIIINENIMKKRKIPIHKIDAYYNNYFFNSIFSHDEKITLTKKQFIKRIFSNQIYKNERFLELIRNNSKNIFSEFDKLSYNNNNIRHLKKIKDKTVIIYNDYNKIKDGYLENGNINNSSNNKINLEKNNLIKNRLLKKEYINVNKKRILMKKKKNVYKYENKEIQNNIYDTNNSQNCLTYINTSSLYKMNTYHKKNEVKYVLFKMQCNNNSLDNKIKKGEKEYCTNSLENKKEILSMMNFNQKHNNLKNINGMKLKQSINNTPINNSNKKNSKNINIFETMHCNLIYCITLIFFNKFPEYERSAYHQCNIFNDIYQKIYFLLYLKSNLGIKNKNKKKFLIENNKMDTFFKFCNSLMSKQDEKYYLLNCKKLKLFFSRNNVKKYFKRKSLRFLFDLLYKVSVIYNYLLTVKIQRNTYGNRYFLNLYIIYSIKDKNCLFQKITKNCYFSGVHVENICFNKRKIFYYYMFSSIFKVNNHYFDNICEYNNYNNLLNIMNKNILIYNIYVELFVIFTLKFFKNFYIFNKSFRKYYKNSKYKLCKQKNTNNVFYISCIKCYKIYLLRFYNILLSKIKHYEINIIILLCFIEEKYLNHLKRDEGGYYVNLFKHNLYYFMRNNNFLKNESNIFNLYNIYHNTNIKNNLMDELNNFFIFIIHFYNYYEIVKIINQNILKEFVSIPFLPILTNGKKKKKNEKIKTIIQEFKKRIILFHGVKEKDIKKNIFMNELKHNYYKNSNENRTKLFNYNILSKNKITTYHHNFLITNIINFLNCSNLITNIFIKKNEQVYLSLNEEEVINNLFIINFNNYFIYYMYFLTKIKKYKNLNNKNIYSLPLLINIAITRKTNLDIIFNIKSISSDLFVSNPLLIFKNILYHNNSNINIKGSYYKNNNNFKKFRYNNNHICYNIFKKSSNYLQIYYYNMLKECFQKYSKTILLLDYYPLIFERNISFIKKKYLKNYLLSKNRKHSFYKSVSFKISKKKWAIIKHNSLFKTDTSKRKCILKRNQKKLDDKYFINNIIKSCMKTKFFYIKVTRIIYKKKEKYFILNILKDKKYSFQYFNIFDMYHMKIHRYNSFNFCQMLSDYTKEYKKNNSNITNINNDNIQHIKKIYINSLKKKKKYHTFLKILFNEINTSNKCEYNKMKLKKNNYNFNDKHKNKKKKNIIHNSEKKKVQVLNESTVFLEKWKNEKLKKKKIQHFFENIQYSSENEDFKIIFENSSNNEEKKIKNKKKRKIVLKNNGIKKKNTNLNYIKACHHIYKRKRRNISSCCYIKMRSQVVNEKIINYASLKNRFSQNDHDIYGKSSISNSLKFFLFSNNNNKNFYNTSNKVNKSNSVNNFNCNYDTCNNYNFDQLNEHIQVKKENNNDKYIDKCFSSSLKKNYKTLELLKRELLVKNPSNESSLLRNKTDLYYNTHNKNKCNKHSKIQFNNYDNSNGLSILETNMIKKVLSNSNNSLDNGIIKGNNLKKNITHLYSDEIKTNNELKYEYFDINYSKNIMFHSIDIDSIKNYELMYNTTCSFNDSSYKKKLKFYKRNFCKKKMKNNNRIKKKKKVYIFFEKINSLSYYKNKAKFKPKKIIKKICQIKRNSNLKSKNLDKKTKIYAFDNNNILLKILKKNKRKYMKTNKNFSSSLDLKNSNSFKYFTRINSEISHQEESSRNFDNIQNQKTLIQDQYINDNSLLKKNGDISRLPKMEITHIKLIFLMNLMNDFNHIYNILKLSLMNNMYYNLFKREKMKYVLFCIEYIKIFYKNHFLNKTNYKKKFLIRNQHENTIYDASSINNNNVFNTLNLEFNEKLKNISNEDFFFNNKRFLENYYNYYLCHINQNKKNNFYYNQKLISTKNIISYNFKLKKLYNIKKKIIKKKQIVYINNKMPNMKMKIFHFAKKLTKKGNGISKKRKKNITFFNSYLNNQVIKKNNMKIFLLNVATHIFSFDKMNDKKNVYYPLRFYQMNNKIKKKKKILCENKYFYKDDFLNVQGHSRSSLMDNYFFQNGVIYEYFKYYFFLLNCFNAIRQMNCTLKNIHCFYLNKSDYNCNDNNPTYKNKSYSTSKYYNYNISDKHKHKDNKKGNNIGKCFSYMDNNEINHYNCYERYVQNDSNKNINHIHMKILSKLSGKEKNFNLLKHENYKNNNFTSFSVKINNNNNKHNLKKNMKYKFNLYIRMEYCNNTLENYINRRTYINFKRNQEIIHMIIIGLHYIHKNNIMHRDLKPSNIFICDNNIVKIGDFGLASYDYLDARKINSCSKEYSYTNKIHSINKTNFESSIHINSNESIIKKKNVNSKFNKNKKKKKEENNNFSLSYLARKKVIYYLNKHIFKRFMRDVKKKRLSNYKCFDNLQNKMLNHSSELDKSEESSNSEKLNKSEELIKLNKSNKRNRTSMLHISSKLNKLKKLKILNNFGKSIEFYNKIDNTKSFTHKHFKNNFPIKNDDRNSINKVFRENENIINETFTFKKVKNSKKIISYDKNLCDKTVINANINTFVENHNNGINVNKLIKCDNMKNLFMISTKRNYTNSVLDNNKMEKNDKDKKINEKSSYCYCTTEKTFLPNSLTRYNKNSKFQNKRNNLKEYDFHLLGNINNNKMFKNKQAKKKEFYDYNYQIKISEKSNFNLKDEKESYHTQGIGTKMYSAPEQLIEHKYTKAVDMFSLGLIIVDLFTITETNMERTKILCNARQRILPDLLIKKHPNVAKLCKNLLSLDYKSRLTSEDLYNRILTVGNVFYFNK